MSALSPDRLTFRCRRRRVRGFSLLELLIAITLLGFILTLLFGAFRLAQNSWDSAERRMAETNDALAARGFLENLLTQAYPLRWKKAPTLKFAFSGDGEHLALVAELPPFLGGGLQQAFLEVKADEQDPDRVRLVFRHAALLADAPDFDPTGVSDEYTVIDKARRITFAYFGTDPSSPLPSPDQPAQWFGEWREARLMPQLIRVQVDSDPAWPELVAHPLIGQEGGCRWDDFHKRCR